MVEELIWEEHPPKYYHEMWKWKAGDYTIVYNTNLCENEFWLYYKDELIKESCLIDLEEMKEIALIDYNTRRANAGIRNE